MKRPAVLTVLLAVLILTALTSVANAEPVKIVTVPVALNPSNPQVTMAGKLKYRGGLELKSGNRRFGGFSALMLSHDGKRLTALSDRGHKLTARILHDRKGNLAGLADTDLSPMTGIDGDPLEGKRNADAEAIAPGPKARPRDWVAAFERKHRLLRYPEAKSRAEIITPPAELHLAPKNSGAEALTRLATGRLVVISEDFATEGGVIGWVQRGRLKPGWAMFTWETNGHFAPTGAATLPGGDVVVLERRHFPLGGFSARILRVGPTAFIGRARIKGEELARLAAPLTADNFEGLDAVRDKGGKTLLYLISDDNFSGLQRTLLLMFELTGR